MALSPQSALLKNLLEISQGLLIIHVYVHLFTGHSSESGKLIKSKSVSI